MESNRTEERRRRRWPILVLLVIVIGAVGGYVLGTRDSGSTATGTPPCVGKRLNAAGGGLVKNGGFETPVVPRGSWQSFAPGQGFPGWLVIGAPGAVSPLSEDFSANGITWNAHSGAQTLDLTGTTNTETGVSQPVTTKVGKDYGLSFWTGNPYDPVGIYATRTATKVLVDGQTVMLARNDGGQGTKTLSWKHFCVPFTATKRITKIAFVNADPSNDSSDIVDDVAVR